ncbi:MAG: hypothetical protein VKJ46_03050 [Leptolyngbyaceae bacterium]|nr:hypothetical protein [Leptolyngbyaceae bacterium]
MSKLFKTLMLSVAMSLVTLTTSMGKTLSQQVLNLTPTPSHSGANLIQSDLLAQSPPQIPNLSDQQRLQVEQEVNRLQNYFGRPTFFEQGRSQLEQEINRLQTAQPAPLLTVQPSLQPWQSFIFKSEGFAVAMPSGAVTEETKTVKMANDPLNFQMLTTLSPVSRFVVAYSEPLQPTQLEDPQAALRIARNAIADTAKFQLTEDQPISLDNYPGREFSLKSADETIKMRVFLIQQRLYALGVSQQNSKQSPEEITTFFNSFRLLNNVSL